MEAPERNIPSAFEAWLGKEVYRERHAHRYVAAYRAFPGARRDVRQDGEVAWEKFLATLDAWAARQMPGLSQRREEQPILLLPLPESRDPMTGLRRGHRAQPVSVNSAPEETLRQVPGIGASCARQIAKERAYRGPFEALEHLVARGCMSPEALQLSRPYLTVSEDRPVFDASMERKINFATYVRLRHALDGNSHDRDMGHMALAELEKAMEALSRNTYWETSRSLRDPAVLSIDDGHAQYKKIRDAREDLLAAMLDSEAHRKLLTRIFSRATDRIWVQAPSLGVLHVGALRPLLMALSDAAARNIDVRVLFDENYAPGPIESDDIAYLAARHVACRAYPLAARMHSRVIIADRDHVICGSHSWSARSMFHSEELGVYVRSSRLAEQQAQRFQLLWQAAAPERRFELSLFRFWPDATHAKLSAAGVKDPRQIASADAVEGLPPEELSALRREVRLVTEKRLPISIAHRLAKAGIEDLQSIADLDASKLEETVGSRPGDPESSDLTPLTSFFSGYLRKAGT